jgi:pyruvate,water dikinase
MCAAYGDETAVAEFQRQLTYARQSMVGLENHNHLIEQVAGGQLRLAVMAAAQWLMKQGVLADVEDVFWLTFVEIERALRGNPPSPQPSPMRERESDSLPLHGGGSGWGSAPLHTAIKERRAAWEQWAKLVPPPILGIPEAVLPTRPPFADDVNVGEAEMRNGRLTGLGASPGLAEGRACVIAKGASLPDLEPGKILVAQNAGPLWTPYFPQLGGLILEEGSLGQHAAATAREYGIPAVINCHRATQLIEDGAWVKIDGAQGIVEMGSETET